MPERASATELFRPDPSSTVASLYLDRRGSISAQTGHLSVPAATEESLNFRARFRHFEKLASAQRAEFRHELLRIRPASCKRSMLTVSGRGLCERSTCALSFDESTGAGAEREAWA